MKIITRYLFINLLQPLVYLTAAFTLLFIIGDLMDNGSDFLNHQTPIGDIAYYYGLRLPSMVIMIIPICLLLAVVYSLSMLTRHSEITAMRASGISIFHITYPYLFMGFICSLIAGGVNEFYGPHFAYRADQFLNSLERSNDAYSHQLAFKNPDTGNTWHVERFDTRTFSMTGVTLTEEREDGSDRCTIKAEAAFWMEGHWWFKNLSQQNFNKDGFHEGPATTAHSRVMVQLTEQPQDFLNDLKDPMYLSAMELKHYIKTHEKSLAPTRLKSYQVDFHHKLTQPLICMIIILLGIPVGAHTGRRGAFAGIMNTLLMFFGFYALQFVMIYLAKQLLIPVWLGPWGAVILFSSMGSLLIYRMR